MTPILSKVLGNNAFYTDTYIKDTITFVKSFLIKNHEEAKLYNGYLKLSHPTHNPNSNPNTWRYYKHLQGLPHPLDTPIVLTSLDNGAQITLTRAALQVHKKTRKEILKFALLFDTLIKQHPQQQLYIKAVALTPIHTDVETIIDLPDFTIVAFDHNFIEENEHDIIPELQSRINNYKPIWLIPYYQNLDNLFLASQYTVFYQFLFTSLLGIRLQNAKTMKAHSFHIRLYLASHYRLDQQMLFLSRRQQLYLYRNLRYLNNHAGKNHVFRSLIDELFNEHNVSVVNYVYNQKNTLTPQNHVDYVYNQKLLNTKSLVFTKIDYNLEYLKAKETPLAPGNKDEYTYNYPHIDSKNKRSLFSTLLTKDLETILVDETDTVRYKLTETLTDYWAYLVKHNHINFLTEVTDPLSNISVRLNTRDLFKLYVITLFASQGVSISTFPTYRIKRVFNPVVPTPAQLEGLFYQKRFEYTAYLQELCEAVPGYTTLMTSFEFGEFVTNVYRLNIGVWHLLSNYSDIDTEGQIAMAVKALTISEEFSYADESVTAFLQRVGVRDPRGYEKDTLTAYVFTILDEVFDKKLSYIKRLKKLQQALADVFFNFNSYTVQLINNYYNDSPILAGTKDSRYGSTQKVKSNIGNGGGIVPIDPNIPIDPNVPIDPNAPIDPDAPIRLFLTGSHQTLMPSHILTGPAESKHKDLYSVGFNITNEANHSLRSNLNLNALVQLDVQPYILTNLNVNLANGVVFETSQSLRTARNTDVVFKTDITHLYNKHYFYADIAFNVFVNAKTRYRSFMSTLAPLNVDITEDPVQAPMTSSDHPTLLFLALNSQPV